MMKKIMVVGDPAELAIKALELLANEKFELVIVSNDNIPKEQIDKLVENQNIVNLPEMLELTENRIETFISSKPSRRHKKWHSPYKFHR